MTELHSEYCLVCKEERREDFSCLFKEGGLELSETGLLFQELLQIVIYVNETHLYLCATCTLQLKQFHEFKKKSIESYSNLLEISGSEELVAVSTTVENGQVNSCNSLSGSSQEDNVRVEEVSVFNANSEKTEQFQIKYIEDDDEEPTINNSNDLQHLLEQSIYEGEILNDNCHKCDICYEIFESLEALNNHKQLHIEPNKCDFCSDLFWDDKQYMSHLHRHIKNGPPYQCQRCPQKYQDKKYFVEHLTFHVFGLKCIKCDKMFYRKNLLQVHLRTTHATERRYACRTCGKRFKSSSHLRNHHYSHMGKQFQCPLCANRYSTPRTLRDHFKAIHKGDLTFSCEVCEQLFITRDELLDHIREQHVVHDADDSIELDL